MNFRCSGPGCRALRRLSSPHAPHLLYLAPTCTVSQLVRPCGGLEAGLALGPCYRWDQSTEQASPVPVPPSLGGQVCPPWSQVNKDFTRLGRGLGKHTDGPLDGAGAWPRPCRLAGQWKVFRAGGRQEPRLGVSNALTKHTLPPSFAALPLLWEQGAWVGSQCGSRGRCRPVRGQQE